MILSVLVSLSKKFDPKSNPLIIERYYIFMHAEITHKIPNGKLVRISLEYDTATLQHIRICGDFFIHPEETIDEMERSLHALPVEATIERIQHLLDQSVETKKAQLIGIDTLSVATIIHEVIHQ